MKREPYVGHEHCGSDEPHDPHRWMRNGWHHGDRFPEDCPGTEDPFLAGFSGYDGCPAMPCDGAIKGECVASGWCAATTLRLAFAATSGDESAFAALLPAPPAPGDGEA